MGRFRRESTEKMLPHANGEKYRDLLLAPEIDAGLKGDRLTNRGSEKEGLPRKVNVRKNVKRETRRHGGRFHDHVEEKRAGADTFYI